MENHLVVNREEVVINAMIISGKIYDTTFKNKNKTR